MSRIAVFSDVHSNLQAFSSFKKILKNEDNQRPIDEIVFLGDMLTYGPEPIEVIDEICKLSEEFPVKFLIGNHDKLYFDLQEGRSSYYSKLPDFIKESADYTLKQLDRSFKMEFKWLESVVLSDIFFSHANANSFGDWSYIRSVDDATTAAFQVFQKGCVGGVFGHVHRLMDEKICMPIDDSLVINEVRILNFGSVGQPRGNGSSFGLIEVSGNSVNYETRCFKYDKAPLIHKLVNCGFTQGTMEKLLGYYR
jgi:predicted phosphodiesterase